jgi:hypothetical protein
MVQHAKEPAALKVLQQTDSRFLMTQERVDENYTYRHLHSADTAQDHMFPKADPSVATDSPYQCYSSTG